MVNSSHLLVSALLSLDSATLHYRITPQVREVYKVIICKHSHQSKPSRYSTSAPASVFLMHLPLVTYYSIRCPCLLALHHALSFMQFRALECEHLIL